MERKYCLLFIWASRNIISVISFLLIGVGSICALNKENFWEKPSNDIIDWAIISLDDESEIPYVFDLAENDFALLNEFALWSGLKGLAIPEEICNTPWGIFWNTYRVMNESPDKARELLLHVIDDPSSSDTLRLFADFLIAESYLRQGVISIAIDKFNILLKNHPNSVLSGAGYYKLALCYLAVGQYNASVEAAEEAYSRCNTLRDSYWCTDALFIKGVLLVLVDSFSAAEGVAENLELVGELQKAKNIRMLIGRSALEGDNDEPYFTALSMLNYGWTLMDSGKLDSAKIVFSNAGKISDQLRSVSALFAGECAYRIRQWSVAESLFNIARDDTTLKKWILWGLGWTAFRNNNFSLARSRWDSIGADSVFEQEIIFAQAKSFFAQGNYKKTSQLMMQYVDKCKLSCIEGIWILCKSLIMSGDTAMAVKKSGDYLLRYPDNRRIGQAALLVARALFESGKYEFLFEWADSLASSIPTIWGDSLELWAQRSAFRAGLIGKPIEIVKNFAQRRPKSPILPQLWLSIGEQYADLKQFDDAVYCFTRAKASVLPGDTLWCEVQVAMLSALLAKGDTIAASKSLDDLIVNGELYWISLGEFEYAKFYILSNDATSAMKLLKQITEKRSQSPIADSAYFYMAKLYWEFGMSDEALEYLIPLWKKTPSNSVLKIDIAERITNIMWETGDPQNAFRWAFARIDSVPAPCEMARRIGELALDDGLSETASKIMDELIKRKCKDLPVPFLFRMGDIMAQNNRIALACSIFTVIKDINPKDSLGIKAMERLRTFSVDSI